MRDLNHHIPAYRQVARITYADWMCRYNDCGHPIDGSGLQRRFGYHFGKIPATWLVAHSVLQSANPKLYLRLTDSSFILNGEVSILHILNICKARNLQILDGVVVKCLTRVGITMLCHLGGGTVLGQAAYLRSLESINTKLMAELGILRERHRSVEVLREENHGLKQKIIMLDELRTKVISLEAELEAGRQERENWYVSND
jgi:hypothetical protein